MKLSEYVTQVINDPKYGHDLEWVKLNLRRAHLEKIEAAQDTEEAEWEYAQGFDVGDGTWYIGKTFGTDSSRPLDEGYVLLKRELSSWEAVEQGDAS